MYIITSGSSIDLDFEEILLNVNEKPKKWYQKLKLPIFLKTIQIFCIKY
jgi:hypothetical protein